MKPNQTKLTVDSLYTNQFKVRTTVDHVDHDNSRILVDNVLHLSMADGLVLVAIAMFVIACIAVSVNIFIT